MHTDLDASASFFALARTRGVAMQAIKVSVIVGTLLVLINHPHEVYARDVSPSLAFGIALTYLVPYSVSTFSAVRALQRHLGTLCEFCGRSPSHHGD